MKVFLYVFLLTGCAIAAPDPRIFGGEDATPHEFPYMISIQGMNNEDINSDGIHFCGGSIINDRWILTAAHCVNAFSKYNFVKIVAGAHNIRTGNLNEQKRKPRKTVKHPKYPETLGPYDIALVQLNIPFDLNQFVAKVQLPMGNPYYPIGHGTVTGWGSTSNTSIPVYPEILQKAEIPMIPAYKCYSPEAGGFNGHLTTLCAGPLDGSKSICFADSGGPLVQKTVQGETFQIGVVSSGHVPCGTFDQTGKYVNVSFFLQWIHETIGVKIGCLLNK